MGTQPKPCDGKIAVVTGGSNGIGAASARLLAEAGARVFIGYHTGERRARELQKSLPGTGHAILRFALEDPRSLQLAADQIASQVPRLDILVNSAGYTRPIPHSDLHTLDDALFDEILSANARGPYSVIRALLALLQLSDDAVVINVSSIAAFSRGGSNIAYSAAKAALDNMSMSLARVLGPKIRVLCVSPGAVATDFVAGRDRTAQEKAAKETPLGKVVEPEDVALSIMACITHLRLSTGSRIVVDGGRSL